MGPLIERWRTGPLSASGMIGLIAETLPMTFPGSKNSQCRVCFGLCCQLGIQIKKITGRIFLIPLNQLFASFRPQRNPAKILNRENLAAKYWIDWA
jgi:hypothetical protein